MKGRFTLSISLLCIVALLACDGETKQKGEFEAGSTGGTEPGTEHMGEHFEEASAIQSAIMRGDLDAVREPAKSLAERGAVEEMPAGWGPPVEDIRVAARFVGEARTFSAAAQATASLIRTCGKCHETTGAKPRIPQLGAIGIPPTDRIGAVPDMLRHKWAADQMWMALVEPSEEVWNKGVEVLAGTPLDPQEMTDDAGLPNDAGSLTQQIYDLGVRARGAGDWNARAQIYGEFLAACASCHQQLGRGPE